MKYWALWSLDALVWIGLAVEWWRTKPKSDGVERSKHPRHFGKFEKDRAKRTVNRGIK